MHLILSLAIAFLLTACRQPQVETPPSTPPASTQETPPIGEPTPPAPIPNPSAQAIKGWSPEHDQLVAATIPESFLYLPATQMQKFCPEWGQLSKAARLKVWQDLWYSIAMAESSHDGATIYTESTMKEPDSVTGKRIYSEGYFQLSYQDKNAYGSKCDFGYEGEEKLVFLRETNDGKKTGSWKVSGVRNINKFGSNLTCAVRAAEYHVVGRSREFADAMGAYWYVMKRKNKEAYQRVWKNMRARGTPCS